MRLATISLNGRTQAVFDSGDGRVRRAPAPDVGALLQRVEWRAQCTDDRDEVDVDVADLELLPVVPRPEKIVCVGLNYRSHILEMGRELPTHPTLFAKFTRALVGPNAPIEVPAASEKLDWEAELAVIVGSEVRNATAADAASAIAGYTVINDVTARDWQRRTEQWLQGKTWEHTTPLGPWLVTADEVDPQGAGRPALPIRCEVDGDVVQEANTSDLVFAPVDLVAYISTIITLVPGDVIATGTPGGVGAARTPPRFLSAGNVVTTTIEGIGTCRNRCSG